ncbi:hypothetical protein TSUD_190620 [Trifolium subterraneum]|uniref:C2H2-type domain-containing protein n=1 Tax=Trifolium subterraneum TaxID=3900 RepID=A0A2Z6PFZ3_TRISU|nr:hypothetical protein TSUD_190620 [Trifolium subterraneum]
MYDSDIESPQTLIKCLKARRHYYLEVRDSTITKYHPKTYNCMLCDEETIDAKSFVEHMKSTDHKKNLHFGKLTLFKKSINRWPFNDGVMFFDSSIKEEEMSYQERKNEFKNDHEGFKIFQQCLQSVDNDNDLAIDNFEYDPQIPSTLSYDCCYKIYFHDHAQRVGKGRMSFRYDSNCIVEKVWCEWLGGNDLNFDAIDQKSVVKVIIMPYSDSLGGRQGIGERECCSLCDKKMVVGKDVASLLYLDEPLQFGQILCCTAANVRTRYEDRVKQFQTQKAHNQPEWPKDRNEEFHFFHTSCLMHWIMWSEYVKWPAVESDGMLDDLFCPECNTNKDGILRILKDYSSQSQDEQFGDYEDYFQK